MKTLLLITLILTLAGGVHSPAFGMAGDLDRPSLALPEKAEAGFRDVVMAVLNQPAATFLGGRFINASTTLRYGGDTHALSAFLAGLAQCQGARLEVLFRRDLDASWLLQHNAWTDPMKFLVIINLTSDKLRLEDLGLPIIAGIKPAAPPPGSP